jgi:pantoate--beta-alanine ligase
MNVARTITLVRRQIAAARRAGKRIGLVPTMGALHQGHISLIKAARRKADFVVVSIFVNPTQFGPKEDFRKYPRPLKSDLRICRANGVDLVFNPTVKQMYHSENLTSVNVERITEPLCGRSRPGHFRGVTTVCAKLFNIVQPDIAFFGRKDAQQAVVVKQMVTDLDMPLKIVVCPTVREPDGLAISSRNKYLNAKQRKQALCLYESLQKAKKMVKGGVTDPAKVIKQMKGIIRKAGSAKIDYLEIVDTRTLEEVQRIDRKVLIALAVRIGPARLIDNIVL